jgi:hypothetical protein
MATKDFNTAILTAKVFSAGRVATITGTGDAIYTVGASKCAKLQSLTLCSTHSAAVNVDVYVVPNGATAGDSHKIVHTYALGAGDSLTLEGYVEGMMLGEGDIIKVKASVTNVVNAILTGVEGA